MIMYDLQKLYDVNHKKFIKANSSLSDKFNALAICSMSMSSDVDFFFFNT